MDKTTCIYFCGRDGADCTRYYEYSYKPQRHHTSRQGERMVQRRGRSGCDGASKAERCSQLSYMSCVGPRCRRRAIYEALVSIVSIHSFTLLWLAPCAFSSSSNSRSSQILCSASERANVCAQMRVAARTNIYYKFGPPSRPIVNSSTVRMRKFSNTSSWVTDGQG